MPQIRCPNCGMTISLKNRKEADLEMITNAVRSGPRTFTYLLHMTKLPRKTLSLRLRELCDGGYMAKDEGGYVLNGSPMIQSRISGAFRRFSAIPTDKRVRAGIMLALLVVSMPVAAQVLAQLFQSPQTPPAGLPVVNPPAVIGTFTMVLDVQNVNDLYFWQVAIGFNTEEMKVLEVTPGIYPESEYAGMLSNVDDDRGLVTLGDFLLPPASGWSGSGRLATIVFGYFVAEYTPPSIRTDAVQETLLLDSTGNIIPISHVTLAPELP